MNPPNRDRPGPEVWLGSLAFVVWCVLLVRHQASLLGSGLWNDEGETIVAARMVASGMRLYSEVFSQHGPLKLLPGVLLVHLGSEGLIAYRAMIAVLQWAAIAAVFLSPGLPTTGIRMLVAGLVGTVIVAYLPNHWGHMYLYQTLAGLALLVAVAQYVVPSFLNEKAVRPVNVAVGSAALASLPFLAITYLPAAILLWVSAIRRVHLRCTVGASLLAVLANLVLLAAIGSPSGYVAYHLYLNFVIYPEFVRHTPAPVGMTPLLGDFGRSVSVVAFVSGALAVVIWACQVRFAEKARAVVLVAGMASLLIRGSGFQALPFYYGSLGFLVAVGAPLSTLGTLAGRAVAPLAFLAILTLGLAVPARPPGADLDALTERSEFGRVSRLLTGPEDRVIAYPFVNYEYLAAGRMPASGHYFFLPQQYRYNQRPILGIKREPCDDIRAQRPKVMLIDAAPVWGSIPVETFLDCLTPILDGEYRKLAGTSIYVRNDLDLEPLGGARPP